MKTIYITDSNNGATDKNFEYLLGFQPSFGVMILGEGVLKIFLDPRYFGKTSSLSKSLIITQTGISDLKIEFIELKRPFYRNIALQLDSEENIALSAKASFSFYTELEKSLLNNRSKNIISILEEDIFVTKRVNKTDEELEIISKAIEIIDNVYLHIEGLNNNGLLIGMKEKDVRVLIIKKIFEFGGDGESFDTVVASGKNSALPHHFAGDDIIEEGVLLIDMGAIYNGYCSDFTRTFWVYVDSSQEISHSLLSVYNKFIIIYNIVKKAHINTYKSACEGMVESEIDNLSRSIIVEAGYGEFFIHATGHGIGLDVHEVPHIAPQKNLKISNQTAFTIEPGIYIPGEFGIRIEDIVFMKEGKCEKVTSVPI